MKRLCLVLALVTAIPLIGCNSIKKNSNKKNSEPTKISIINRVPATYVADDNPIIKAIEENQNIKLSIEIPPLNSYYDRLNIVMASGEIPDIINCYNDDKFNNWVKDELLLEFDEHLNKIPNVVSKLTPAELEQGRILSTNKLYGLSRGNINAHPAMLIRKDWLEKIGSKIPETTLEFVSLCKDFATKDPDGNGKKDTYGISLNLANLFDPNFTMPFNIRPISVANEKGEYQIPEAQEGFMKLMDFYREIYANGGMDPEWYLNKTYEDNAKFSDGKSGILFKNVSAESALPSPQLIQNNSTAKTTAIPPLKDEKGERIFYSAPSIWGQWCVNADTKNKDKVIDFINYMYSDEAQELTMIGLEGLTYEKFDKTNRYAIVPESMKDNVNKYVSSYMTFNLRTKDGEPVMRNAKSQQELEVLNNNIKQIVPLITKKEYYPNTVFPGILEQRNLSQDATKKRDQNISKYICGTLSRDAFVKFINEEYIPSQQKTLEITKKICNEKYKK